MAAVEKENQPTAQIITEPAKFVSDTSLVKQTSFVSDTTAPVHEVSQPAETLTAVHTIMAPTEQTVATTASSTKGKKRSLKFGYGNSYSSGTSGYQVGLVVAVITSTAGKKVYVDHKYCN